MRHIATGQRQDRRGRWRPIRVKASPQRTLGPENQYQHDCQHREADDDALVPFL
jgi:hypothetical protein